MTDAVPPKRPPGRPRVRPLDESPRKSVTVQASAELYEQLSAQAEERGLSLGRVIEERLEASFRVDRQSAFEAGLLGGARKASLLRALSYVFAPFDIEDPDTSHEAERVLFERALNVVLDAYFPTYLRHLPKEEQPPGLEELHSLASERGDLVGKAAMANNVRVEDTLTSDLSKAAFYPGLWGSVSRQDIANLPVRPPPPLPTNLPPLKLPTEGAEPAPAPKPKSKKAKPLERRDLDARVAELVD